MRPTLSEALTAMRGREIGALLHIDGSVRLQWPDQDGGMPENMLRFTVADARLEGDAVAVVAMDLINPDMSCTCRFTLGAINMKEAN
jgi:hypothetical protein